MFPELTIRIEVEVLAVHDAEYYGIEKKFADAIKPGDILLIESDYRSCFGWNGSGKNHIVSIEGKDISKKLSNNSQLYDLFNYRIKEFKQL